jgi:hypothetical protein
VSDFPIELPDGLVERYGHAFDVEGRLPRALDALGSVAGRDVLLLDTPIDGLRAGQLRALDARVSVATDPSEPGQHPVDVVVGLWSALRRPGSSEEIAAIRLLRPGGRLLAVHDYRRDDVGRLIDTPDRFGSSGSSERREAPFLAEGWRIRVIHCQWTFASIEQARAFAESFGEPGRIGARALSRPRLTHNLALYHRTVGVTA